MNSQEMLRILDAIARDRNIDKDLLVRDLERAMVSALRKYYHTLDTEEFQCKLLPAEGRFDLTRHGEPLQIEPATLGRIAAQTFKQVMIQGFRDEERNSLLEEFNKRVGTVVTGVAQRYDHGALIIQIDRAEAVMLRSEQIPGEQFVAGDRVRALVLDVKDMGSQAKIYLSRANPEFIRRLFEVEVPEVSERIIEIKAIAREPGHRTKIAVSSIDSRVDAVGACVGVRGTRIKNIVDELNGEKIDIVRWNESSQILIANALKPAEVSETSLCFELGRATVVVRDDQLSLAIGKKGQNVRLAARLTGWDVDILTPEEFNKGLETLQETLLPLEGMNEEKLDRLAALGMVSVFDIEEVGPEVLETELELTAEQAAHVIEVTAAKAKIVAEQQAKDKAEKERLRAADREAASRLLEGGDQSAVDAETAAAGILGLGAVVASEGLGAGPAGRSDEGKDLTGAGGSPVAEAGATDSGAVGDSRAAEILGG